MAKPNDMENEVEVPFFLLSICTNAMDVDSEPEEPDEPDEPDELDEPKGRAHRPHPVPSGKDCIFQMDARKATQEQPSVPTPASTLASTLPRADRRVLSAADVGRVIGCNYEVGAIGVARERQKTKSNHKSRLIFNCENVPDWLLAIALHMEHNCEDVLKVDRKRRRRSFAAAGTRSAP